MNPRTTRTACVTSISTTPTATICASGWNRSSQKISESDTEKDARITLVTYSPWVASGDSVASPSRFRGRFRSSDCSCDEPFRVRSFDSRTLGEFEFSNSAFELVDGGRSRNGGAWVAVLHRPATLKRSSKRLWVAAGLFVGLRAAVRWLWLIYSGVITSFNYCAVNRTRRLPHAIWMRAIKIQPV